MSYCSINYLPPRTQRKEISELLQLLEYEWVGSHTTDDLGKIQYYHWFQEKDYMSTSGVELSVYQVKKRLRVETRTPIARSFYDLSHQNRTIRLLKQRLGGWFRSDAGKNRCMAVRGQPPSPAESGCAQAFNRFGHNFIALSIYIKNRNFKEYPKKQTKFFWIDRFNPWLISNNLILPFMVAAAEDYWKSTYLALLKYSPKKENILKPSRISSAQLARISEEKLSVEEAFAETLSFQNVSAVCDHFHQLDSKLNFRALLRKPLRKGGKASLFRYLEEMVHLRHNLIHGGEINESVSEEKLRKMKNRLKESITKCYKKLIRTYGWQYNPGWMA